MEPRAFKPLLVGEDNPYSTDPRYALWCAPPRSAGARLFESKVRWTRDALREVGAL